MRTALFRVIATMLHDNPEDHSSLLMKGQLLAFVGGIYFLY
jgi:hypothetical protein